MPKVCLQAGLSKEYIAGFLDGEGWFRIVKRIPQKKHNRNLSYQILVGVSSTDKTVLSLIKKQYGGSINKRVKKDGWKPEYNLIISCRQAEKLIKDIIQFLVLKKDRANLCLLLNKNIEISCKKISVEDLKFRDFLFLKIKNLNKRGTKND